MKETSIPAAWRKVLPPVYAAATVFTFLLMKTWTQTGTAVFAFPFEQSGLMLSSLSRWGAVGGGLAAMLWILPSVLMAARAWQLRGNRSRRWEFLTLILLAVVIPAALYLMVNPASLLARFPLINRQALPVLRAILGGAVWSCLILYAIVRLTPILSSAGHSRLMFFLFTLVAILGGAFAVGLGIELREAVNSFESEGKQAADNALAALRLVFNLVSFAALYLLVFRSLSALEKMSVGEDEAPLAVKRLAAGGLLALKIIAASTAAINLLQLLLSRGLSDVHIQADFPLSGLIFSLAALLFSRLYTENRRLKNENESFI